MKNIFNTKKSLATALSRYGRVLSLLIVALTLSNAAWSKLYIYGGINQDNPSNFVKLGETDGTSFTWDRSSESEKFVASKYYRCIFTTTDSKTQSDLQSNGIYVKNITGVNYFNYCQKVDWSQIYFVNFQPNTTLSSVTITISAIPSSKECNYFSGDRYCADYNVVGTPYVCTATAPTLTTGTLTYSHPTVTVTDNNLVSLGQNADCSSVNCFQRGVELTTDKSSSSIPRLPASGVTTGTFSLSQDYALSENVTYYYRAFATTNNTTASAATGYGEWKEFTYGTHDETPATVRVGAKPTVTPSTGAVIHAYLALQGCHGGASATISKITAYYSTSEPTTSSAHVDLTGGTYTQGNSYDITIPAAKLDELGTGVTTVRVKLSATNDNTGTQESALSDEIRFTWSGCTAPSITGHPTSATYCQNATATALSVTATGTSLSYKWQKSTDSGTSYSDISGATSDSYIPIVTTAGTTLYKCVVSSSCTSATATSNAATITVNALPTATISGNDAVCQGGTLQLTGSGGTSYKWNTEEYSATSTFNVTTTSAGEQTITLKVKDANDCESAEASKTVTVNALPTAEISGDDAVCQGGTLTLTGSGAANYSWNGGAYTTTNTYSVTTTSAGEQTITLKVKDANSCESAETSKTVTVNAIPTAVISGDAAVCQNGTLTLTGSGAGDEGTYSWNGGTFGSTSTYNVPTSSTGSQTIKLKVKTASGCESAEVSKSVTVNALPTATITGDDAVCQGGTLQLTGSGGTSYKWNTAEYSATSTFNVTTSSAGSQTIKLKVKDANDCESAEASKTVTVNANPELTLTGVGAKSASTTYPWEYMTVTATTDANLTWNPLEIPESGIGATDYVYETGATENVKKLKSKQTADPNNDKFIISATATENTCTTTKTYNVYINAAPAEQCN